VTIALRHGAAREFSLLLANANGDTIAYRDYGHAFRQIDNFFLPTSGDYVIGIDGEGTDTGSYTLCLNLLVIDGQLTYDDCVELDIAPIGDQDSFTFEGGAGDRITLILDHGVAHEYSLLLADAAGDTVAYRDYSHSYRQIDDFALPESTTYTVTVDVYGDDSGDYTLCLNHLVIDGQLTYDDCVELDIAPMGDQDSFTFEGVAGDRINLILDHGVAHEYSLLLADAAGDTVAYREYSGSYRQINDIALPETTTYTVTVDVYGDNSGSYTLCLNHLVIDGQVAYGECLDFDLMPMGDMDSYTFTGTGEELVTATLDHGVALDFSLVLSDAQGDTIAVCEGYGGCSIENTAIETSGTHILTVDGYGTDDGDYTVCLYLEGMDGVAHRGLPLAYFLSDAVPNPFNPATVIEYSLPERSSVTLCIFDLAGRLVNVLVEGEEMAAGTHSATWTGRDAHGHSMPSSTYFCRLEADGFVETRRMTLIR